MWQATVIALALVVLGSSRTPKPMSAQDLNAAGQREFGSNWNPADGDWLPRFGDVYEPWRQGKSAQISQRDGFVYEDKSQVNGYLPELGPADGTYIIFGIAGPEHAHVAYDRANKIAFYGRWCCSAGSAVAALGIPPPPNSVMRRDLSTLRTARGIRLGQTRADVTRIYGKALLIPVPGHPDVDMLAYTTWPPYKSRSSYSQCGQIENFVFRHDKLIFIEFGNGC